MKVLVGMRWKRSSW